MNPFGEPTNIPNQPNTLGQIEPQAPSHAHRIMDLQKRICELETGLQEAAQRIMRLEQLVGDAR